MGILKSLSLWLRADAAVKMATADAIDRGDIGRDGDEHEEGNNFSDTQLGNPFSTEPELHAGWRPSHQWWGDEDRGHISLRYTGNAHN